MRLRMGVPVSGSIIIMLILVTVAVAAVTLRGRRELTVEKPTENVRAAPDGKKIGTLLRGASVERLGQDGKWVQFRLEGWIWGPSLEGFKEEVDAAVTDGSPVGYAQNEADKRAPRPALREREQLQRIKEMFDDEFGVFYGVSHDKIRSQLIIRFRAADLVEFEALEQRQRELEEKAAIELGQMLLGTGIETFSKKIYPN